MLCFCMVHEAFQLQDVGNRGAPGGSMAGRSSLSAGRAEAQAPVQQSSEFFSVTHGQQGSKHLGCRHQCDDESICKGVDVKWACHVLVDAARVEVFCRAARFVEPVAAVRPDSQAVFQCEPHARFRRLLPPFCASCANPGPPRLCATKDALAAYAIPQARISHLRSVCCMKVLC